MEHLQTYIAMIVPELINGGAVQLQKNRAFFQIIHHVVKEIAVKKIDIRIRSEDIADAKQGKGFIAAVSNLIELVKGLSDPHNRRVTVLNSCLVIQGGEEGTEQHFQCVSTVRNVSRNQKNQKRWFRKGIILCRKGTEGQELPGKYILRLYSAGQPDGQNGPPLLYRTIQKTGIFYDGPGIAASLCEEQIVKKGISAPLLVLQISHQLQDVGGDVGKALLNYGKVCIRKQRRAGGKGQIAQGILCGPDRKRVCLPLWGLKGDVGSV